MDLWYPRSNNRPTKIPGRKTKEYCGHVPACQKAGLMTQQGPAGRIPVATQSKLYSRHQTLKFIYSNRELTYQTEECLSTDAADNILGISKYARRGGTSALV